jgi:methyltransferase (TIGR00027 family)
MQTGKPSQTAAWVAAARSLGQLLPKSERLAYDPYGVAFLTGPVRKLSELLMARPLLFSLLMARSRPLRAFIWWMQLRTRALDDILLEFIASGGRQVLLLGAGYDCRAVRFAHLLEEANVFEVDHPSTQRHKQSIVAAAELKSPSRYVAWDFENDGLSGLGQRLVREGFSRSHRVLTIWEGVTMYLSESTIASTFELLGRLGANGSWLAFNYLDRRALDVPDGEQKLTQRLVRGAGEPHRFGWEPDELSHWLQAHSYVRMWDHSDRDLARRHLSEVAAAHFAGESRRVALARSEVLLARGPARFDPARRAS